MKMYLSCALHATSWFIWRYTASKRPVLYHIGMNNLPLPCHWPIYYLADPLKKGLPLTGPIHYSLSYGPEGMQTMSRSQHRPTWRPANVTCYGCPHIMLTCRLTYKHTWCKWGQNWGQIYSRRSGDEFWDSGARFTNIVKESGVCGLRTSLDPLHNYIFTNYIYSRDKFLINLIIVPYSLRAYLFTKGVLHFWQTMTNALKQIRLCNQLYNGSWILQ